MIVIQGQQQPTPPALEAAERDVLTHTNGSSVWWCGRGSAALLLGLRLLAEANREGEVILPTICCPSLAYTVRLARLTPRFADVDPGTGLMTLAAAQERRTENTVAVVFIHLYGQTADLCGLADWCRTEGVALIEDAAHALGGQLASGAAVGSVGDLTVYSFSRSKILECGGGALLIRCPEQARAAEEIISRSACPAELDAPAAGQLARSQRNFQHAMVALCRLGQQEGVSEAVERLGGTYDRLYWKSMDDASAVAAGWKTLSHMLQRRLSKAQQYASLLRSGPWRILDGWQQSGVCWRVTLSVDPGVNPVSLSEAVRQDGFHVSNLYWCMNDLFRPQDRCPNGEAFACRVVNLWVDDTVDADWIRNCCSSLLRHARRVPEAVSMVGAC